MKVLFLLAYYYPETAASIYLFENLIDSLVNDGVQVELVVPIPGRGVDCRINKEFKKRRNEYEKGGLLHIHRFNMYMEPKGTIARFVRYFYCCIKYLYYGIKYKNVDVIFSESTPPILGATAVLIKKVIKKPLVYNLQDIFPDSLVLTGVGKKDGLAWKIGRKIENFTYRNSDKIITISQDFRKNILAKGVPSDKIVIVYNWVDQNVVINIQRDQNVLFDRYRLDRDKFYVTYNGNIGLSQNMDMLLEVAKDFQTEFPDINFVFVGNGAYLDEVKRMVAENKLKNVHLLPFQPYEEISFVFSLGDASLVISKPGTGNGCVPSKTWSIMSAARPVLANFDENELKDIIINNNCGIFTKAGDKEAFKQSILTLYNNRDMAVEMGRNGRQFVMENLTREVGTQKYVDVIKSVALSNQ